MGKTIKGKEKAKAKVVKAARKIARKCKGAAMVLAVAVLTFAGCSTADSQQPAKSQTQNNSFADCTIIVAAKVALPTKSATNQTIQAEGGALPTLELFTQTQSLESTGSTETLAASATLTPKTDIKPDIDVNYAQGGNAGSGAAASGKGAAGILESLTAASLDTLKDYITNGKSGTVQLQKTDGTTTTATCQNGLCTVDGVPVTKNDCATCTDR